MRYWNLVLAEVDAIESALELFAQVEAGKYPERAGLCNGGIESKDDLLYTRCISILIVPGCWARLV